MSEELKTAPETSHQGVQLVCTWWDRKQEVDNGLKIDLRKGVDGIGSLKFGLKNRSPDEPEYDNLLCAKIFETFGVCEYGLAAAALTDCLNCIPLESATQESKGVLACLETHCKNVLSLFQEMRPRDSIELMLTTKIIILDYLSNREFIGSASTDSDDKRTTRQIRGIKLSRLLLEFKEKRDKHRKPDQQIHVQHNHIYNEGQAIIGSQLSTGG